MRLLTHTTTSYTRMSGLTLWLGRIIWVLLAMAHLWLYWLSLTHYDITYASRQNAIDLNFSLQQLGLNTNLVFQVESSLELVVVLVNVVFALLAFWRRSDDWVVLLFSFELVSLSIMVSANSTDTVSLVYPETTLLWFLFRQLSLALTLWMLYLLPDGRLVPRWSYLPGILWTLWLFLHPLFVTFPERIDLIFQSVAFASGGAAQLHRYLKVSNQAQRQQGKWMLFGICLVLFGFFISTLLHFIPAYNLASPTAVFLRILEPFIFMVPRVLLPVFLLVAVLRYRLWDVDFLINRSLVYGFLSLFLAGILGLSLFLISRLAENFQGGPLLAVGISAALFGAAFRPVQRRIQRWVDKYMYHIEIEYLRHYTRSSARGGSSHPTLTHTALGEYKNLELIGRGGMAEIYKAIHPEQGFPVAIKILRASLSQDEQFQHRFRREARVVASLQHPNIVHQFDYGDEGGVFYMVMEYLPGEDLGVLLKRKQRLSLEEALPILTQVADALDYAHAKGLVHRDVKPSNIMLSQDENGQPRAVLMDFGITKILGGETAITRTGMLGTLDYIAPEQIKASDEVDARADQYALGVLAYQMLTGELPFRYSNPGALLIAHLQQPAPTHPKLPAPLCNAIQRALAKSPAERFGNLNEFIFHLQEAVL